VDEARRTRWGGVRGGSSTHWRQLLPSMSVGNAALPGREQHADNNLSPGRTGQKIMPKAEETHTPLRVEYASLLEDLGDNRNSTVDRVADNADESCRAVLCDCRSEVGNDACVDLCV
jgi:hypothetical protein